MKLCHLGEPCLRTAEVAETPACHGICLGETGCDNGSLHHAVNRCDGHVTLAIGKLSIDLIREDSNISLTENVGKSPELFPLKNSAGRVIGIRKDEHLRLLGNSRAKLIGSELEAVLFLCIDDNRHATRHADDGLVAHE